MCGILLDGYRDGDGESDREIEVNEEKKCHLYYIMFFCLLSTCIPQKNISKRAQLTSHPPLLLHHYYLHRSYTRSFTFLLPMFVLLLLLLLALCC